MPKRFLITGGAGFIGFHFIETLRDLPVEILVIDKCTYAAHPMAIQHLTENNILIRGDVSDRDFVEKTIRTFRPNTIVHFAAESHVDRSILSPTEFLTTNFLGTHALLQASLSYYNENRSEDFLFVQISTDEVYGPLGDHGQFNETSPLNPSSPYSASKAAADHLVRAYHTTYNLPVMITRCSNNYGPRQFPEKLIPLMISRALENLPLPLYGHGGHVREWIFVKDHCEGILSAIERGRVGEVYHLGGGVERKNIDVVCAILEMLGKPKSLITFVEDRKGHDFRYALDNSKAEKELGWRPRRTFEEGLEETLKWYLDEHRRRIHEKAEGNSSRRWVREEAPSDYKSDE